MGMKKVIIVVVLMFLFVESKTMNLSLRSEWFALLELRSTMGIKGKDWPIKAEPCENWKGVQCKNGRVVSIKVSGLKRTRLGRLNPSFEVDALANFTLLESFNASGFVLNGSIPEWFGEKLFALQVLDLSSCSITGMIPSSLGSLGKLRLLFLSGNNLTGRLFPNLELLSGLSVLDLSGNLLSGSLPDSFSMLENLTRLDLSNNYLSGSVPPQLGSLLNLQSLNLSDNAFSGLVPSELGKLYKLVELDLSMNSLSGLLPSSLFSSSLVELQVMILSKNLIGGSLPDALWSMPSLQFFDVSENNFTGQLPLPKLSGSNVSSAGAVFNLSNNLFYGPLNGFLNKYKMIDLTGNYLEGEVQIGSLSNVTLARNCIQKIPNQRGLEDCKFFYVQRNLPFVGGDLEPTAEAPFPESDSKKNKRLIFILAGVFGGIGFIVLLVLVLLLILKQCHFQY